MKVPSVVEGEGPDRLQVCLAGTGEVTRENSHGLGTVEIVEGVAWWVGQHEEMLLLSRWCGDRDKAQRVRAPAEVVGGAGVLRGVGPAARLGAEAAQAPGNQTAVYCSMASRSPVVTAPSHGGRPGRW